MRMPAMTRVAGTPSDSPGRPERQRGRDLARWGNVKTAPRTDSQNTT